MGSVFEASCVLTRETRFCVIQSSESWRNLPIVVNGAVIVYGRGICAAQIGDQKPIRLAKGRATFVAATSLPMVWAARERPLFANSVESFIDSASSCVRWLLRFAGPGVFAAHLELQTPVGLEVVARALGDVAADCALNMMLAPANHNLYALQALDAALDLVAKKMGFAPSDLWSLSQSAAMEFLRPFLVRSYVDTGLFGGAATVFAIWHGHALFSDVPMFARFVVVVDLLGVPLMMVDVALRQMLRQGFSAEAAFVEVYLNTERLLRKRDIVWLLFRYVDVARLVPYVMGLLEHARAVGTLDAPTAKTLKGIVDRYSPVAGAADPPSGSSSAE